MVIPHISVTFPKPAYIAYGDCGDLSLDCLFAEINMLGEELKEGEETKSHAVPIAGEVVLMPQLTINTTEGLVDLSQLVNKCEEGEKLTNWVAEEAPVVFKSK